MPDDLIGARLERVEDEPLLTGRGRFVDDIHLPGMLHAGFVRSEEAHAKISGIDASAAKALEGVHGVFALADLPAHVQEKRSAGVIPHPALKQPVMPHLLAKDEVRHVGEPVAIVVADDRYIAEDAAQLVLVDYEPLPVAGDVRAAAEPGAPTAHSGAPDNIAADMQFAYGDVDAAFAKAAHVVGGNFFAHRGGGHSIEGRAALAAYDPVDDRLTVYAACQGPHSVQRALVETLEWDEQQVRVVAPDVGGGFGPKMMYYAEYAVVALAAVMLKRPVKWVEDRREHFLGATQERDQHWDVEVAADADGMILGLRGRLIHDKGAYLHHGVLLPMISSTTLPGPYVVPSYRVQTLVVLTNKPPVAPVRGAGRPQAVFAMERLLDRLAQKSGIDPAELRRRNLVPPERMPYDVGLTFRDGKPLRYDSGDYPRCLDLALEKADYAGFRARQAAARADGRHIGIGIANCVEGTGLGPFEGATVRIGPSGKIVLLTGAAAQGQGHATCFAQICAEKFGVAIEDVHVVAADTGVIPNGTGTFASRQAVNAGSSVHLAALDVRDKTLRIASHMLEAAQEDLEIAAGKVTVKGTDRSVALSQVSRAVTGLSGFALPPDLDPGLESTRYFTPEQAVYPNGSHVAVVEVDVETGDVKVLDYSIGHDCGVVINPLVVEGQIIGGLAHGIGNALLERMHYDEAGQPLTTTLADYLLPTADVMPRIAIGHTVSPSPLNPIGVKGAGEGGTIPAIAAIVSAVEDALSPYGITINEAPITPPRIVELIETARQMREGGG